MTEEPKRKIRIFKPFGEAFELTKKILFQPFDIGEMVRNRIRCVSGRSFSGGMNFNFNPRGFKDTPIGTLIPLASRFTKTQ